MRTVALATAIAVGASACGDRVKFTSDSDDFTWEQDDAAVFQLQIGETTIHMSLSEFEEDDRVELNNQVQTLDLRRATRDLTTQQAAVAVRDMNQRPVDCDSVDLSLSYNPPETDEAVSMPVCINYPEASVNDGVILVPLTLDHTGLYEQFPEAPEQKLNVGNQELCSGLQAVYAWEVNDEIGDLFGGDEGQVFPFEVVMSTNGEDACDFSTNDFKF